MTTVSNERIPRRRATRKSGKVISDIDTLPQVLQPVEPVRATHTGNQDDFAEPTTGGFNQDFWLEQMPPHWGKGGR